MTLVEAGDADLERAAELQVPLLFPRAFGGPADWGFQTVPQPGLDGRVIPVPRGRGLGGSSAINAQLWLRGHHSDYDQWSAAGLDGWGYADVAPCFDRAESQLRLTGLRYPLPVTADFISACAQLGYAPAAERQEGYALARVTHRDGLRWSSANGYLWSAMDRPNLTVLTGVQACQIRRASETSSLFHRPVPAGLTGDVVGTVERVGQGADPALTGGRVAALTEDSCAEYVVADVDWLVPVSATLSAEAASVLPTMGAVALGALRLGRLTEGDTVLVTAAAGGIGHLAVQLARHLRDGTVIAAAGTAAKAGFLKDLGADIMVDYSQPDWADQVRDAVPGGVNVILEAVGGDTLLDCIGLLAPFGRVVGYGAASGDWGSVPVLRLAALKTLSAFSLLALRAAAPEQARANIAELTGLLESGELRAVTRGPGHISPRFLANASPAGQQGVRVVIGWFWFCLGVLPSSWTLSA